MNKYQKRDTKSEERESRKKKVTGSSKNASKNELSARALNSSEYKTKEKKTARCEMQRD